MARRQLYQCFNAKVNCDYIICAKGHHLRIGELATKPLMRGDPLELAACQKCTDYDEMGPPIPKEERGWIG